MQAGRISHEDIRLAGKLPLCVVLGPLCCGGWAQGAEQLAELGPGVLLHSCMQALADCADVAQPLHCGGQVPQGVLCQALLQDQAPQL